MPQTQPDILHNILQLAKQGNPKAIATLINRQLEPKGIIATVDLKDNCLQILIEAVQLPPQQIIVEYFRKSFSNLDTTAFKTIKVYAKRPGEVFFDWHDVFDLVETAATELLRMTKFGDNKSITLMINQCLQSQGVIAQVSLKDGCLRIMLESQETPNQQLIVPILTNELDKLNIESVNKLIVYGKQSNENFPVWHQEINYNLLTDKSGETVESSALVSANGTESQNIMNASTNQIENIDCVKLSNYLYYDFLQTRIYEPLSIRLKAEQDEKNIHEIVKAFKISTLEEDIQLSIRHIKNQIIKKLEGNFYINLDANNVKIIFDDIYDDRFSSIRNAIQHMAEAIQEVLNFNFPQETDELKAFFKEGTAGFIDGFLGIAPKEAIVGSVIGNLIIPGFGGVIGGAVGGWFAGNNQQKEQQKKIEEILNKYDKAKNRLDEEFKILLENSYELICNLLYKQYQINLIKCDNFRQSEDFFYQGNICFNDKKFTESINLYDRAIDLNPYHYIAWYNKGYALFLLKQYEESIQAYDETLKINNQYINALEMKLIVLRSLEKYETILLLCNNAIDECHNTFCILYEKTFALHKLKRYEEVIKNCDAIISSYTSRPNIYEILVLKSASLVWLNETELALENIKEAVILNPEKSQLLIANSPSFDRLKNDEIFIKLMESSVGIDYSNLKQMLSEQKWRGADIETARILCLAVTYNEKRLNIIPESHTGYTWLSCEHILNLPSRDLNTINNLWLTYSNSKFGFSIQNEIYQSLGGTKEFNGEIRDKFGMSVVWRTTDKDGNYFWRNSDDCHFYIETAPIGHLPSCLWAGMNDGWFGENRRDRLITLFYHLEASNITGKK
ncbi:GUN4 domain-containing protein [Anabaena minutissima FACHB-250]|nr:GUN4 domain-containing protein [Anabaena minutissima FACHB-250]